MTKRSLAKQGQSDSTEFKERGLEAAFAINLRVFRAKFGLRFPYWHFDLNCGSGYNEKIGCIGSPLAFIRSAEGAGGVKYRAGFCDKNEEALRELINRKEVSENSSAFCFHGNNVSLIHAIPDIIKAGGERPSMAMGMILSDPNGAETPVDELAELSKTCPRIDFAIHWNSRVRRLFRGHDWEFVDIDEAIEALNKKHWLIRKPMGAHQWTVLIGRNAKIGDHKAMGYHHLDSDVGREILKKCKARIDGSADKDVGDSEQQLAFGF